MRRDETRQDSKELADRALKRSMNKRFAFLTPDLGLGQSRVANEELRAERLCVATHACL